MCSFIYYRVSTREQWQEGHYSLDNPNDSVVTM
jgi:hypothetical protein